MTEIFTEHNFELLAGDTVVERAVGPVSIGSEGISLLVELWIQKHFLCREPLPISQKGIGRIVFKRDIRTFNFIKVN